jgi:DNA-binding transcriptional LysR family regulator
MITELIRFKKVADVRIVTKASKLLFITQPALTQSLHRLEQELNLKLLKTTNKGVVLTEEGEIVYEVAIRIIQLWDNAKQMRALNIQKIPVGLFDSAALTLSFYLQNKSVNKKIELTIDRSENLLKKINIGVLDICVCVLPRDLKDYQNAILVKTYKEKLIPVASSMREGKIDKIPFILYSKESQTGRFVDGEFVKKGIQPNIVAESVNPLFIKELALTNFGVGILPLGMVADDIKRKKLFVQKLPFSFERTCGIFKSKNQISREADTVLSELAKQVIIRE